MSRDDVLLDRSPPFEVCRTLVHQFVDGFQFADPGYHEINAAHCGNQLSTRSRGQIFGSLRSIYDGYIHCIGRAHLSQPAHVRGVERIEISNDHAQPAAGPRNGCRFDNLLSRVQLSRIPNERCQSLR